ncbi:hypothetical protein [uncultured Jannaschia sp.]|uniref:OmpA family protein n=1 Tax=uncultured Jannaschia sp. TaxID=293347 RepID=UPI00260B571C|nr:hypothetical protein [uncultured Jannaschia sp.]
MPVSHDGGAVGATSRQYRRGALLGMTLAEAFILIAFALLLLLAAWKTQADEERDRYMQIKDLTAEQIEDIVTLTETDRLHDAAALAESEVFEDLQDIERSGADVVRLSQIATEEERWRFIDKDELLRIVQGAQQLPEDIQRDLADLVEIDDPRQIVELLKMTERADTEELRRILEAAEDLPENIQEELAAFVEAEDPDDIVRMLEMTVRAEEDESARERLAGIGAQIDAVRDAEGDLVADLRRTLGDAVEAVGGRITKDGSVVLQDTILFDVGSARVTARMKTFLERMCVPWMQVMMRSEVDVAGAQIEGHASSEWRTDSTAQEAYLNNLDLSQRRSAAVLRECLAIVSGDAGGPALEEWARSHLQAIGFSSARPVLNVWGRENPKQSRRVVFSLDLDRDGLIEDLEGEVRRSASAQP